MKTYYDCLPCFVNQALKSLKSVKEEHHEAIMRDVMHALGNIDFSLSPEMADKIFKTIRKYTGDQDLYLEQKENSNRYILKMYDDLNEAVANADDQFETALRLAVAGNIIDFGAKHDFSDEIIHQEIDEALSIQLDKTIVNKLKDEIEKADQILYLGDNAGEIVFDKLFLNYLPKDKVTFAVRGYPVINDATMQEAEDVGLCKMVKVVSNGSTEPGTVVANCSEEFKTCFNNAGLIISKGQGNYETLSQVDKNIFFLLKIKCDVIARDLNRKRGDFVIQGVV